MRPAPVFLILALLTLASCSKREGIPTMSTYTFSNHTDARITFNVYGSKEDYATAENLRSRNYIEPGSALRLSLDVAHTYWIDWYDSTLSLNNWRNTFGGQFDDPYPLPEVTVAALDDQYEIRVAGNDTSRSILLQGNGIESNWQGSITSNPGLDGQYTFVFRKDFTGSYTLINPSGIVLTKAFSYRVSGNRFQGKAGDFWLQLYDSSKAKVGSVSWNPFLGSRDSLHFGFATSPPFLTYPMSRK